MAKKSMGNWRFTTPISVELWSPTLRTGCSGADFVWPTIGTFQSSGARSRIFPFLLGLTPVHDCYGTQLRIFVYDLPQLTQGVLHCHHGQWGLEVTWWWKEGWWKKGVAASVAKMNEHKEENSWCVRWKCWTKRFSKCFHQLFGSVHLVGSHSYGFHSNWIHWLQESCVL